MKTIKKEDHYLLKNSQGEYHFSIEEYEKLGEEKAKEVAEKEIEKKLLNKSYTNNSINFNQARELGFCEYGINDFCKRLNLDVNKTYTISELYQKIDIHTLIEYPDECLKLFTDKIFDKFGGIIEVLDENRSRTVLNLVINKGRIEDNLLHELAYYSAMRVVENYEKQYPEDKRVRSAIEAKKDWVLNNIDKEKLSAAQSAARSAAESTADSAAESAAWSAWSAARSTADSAAKSAAWSEWSAAESAAESAAWSAWSAAKSAAWSEWSVARSAAWSEWSVARSTELNFQIDTLIDLLENGSIWEKEC